MKSINKRNIKNRLYIATVCGECAQISQQYEVGIELDHFCMAEKMDGDEAKNAKGEIAELLQKVSAQDAEKNAPPLILHAPFNELFPAAIDPKARELAMARLENAAQLAMHYGAEKMVVHSGYIPFVYFKEWHIARSIEFWDEFMEGKPDDFRIVIENVLEDEPYMMTEMIRQITNRNIKLCLDIGHANCMSQVPVSEWLEVMTPYLGHLHIHNNDGSHDYHKPLDEGTIDMDEFLGLALDKGNEDVSITIESLEGISSMKWLEAKGYI